MGHRFAEIAFTESVREVQQALGSRDGYAGMEGGEDYNNLLGQREADFIAARDSFYMASVSETGWPYVQHRGGPRGFMRVIDEKTIGFADFSGNRQYISVGNFRNDDRVSLFFMDYPNRTRFKILGRVRLIVDDEPELLAQLEMDDYRARVERGLLVTIEAVDWNCPQHITPRYTDAEVEALIAPIVEQNRQLQGNQSSTTQNEYAVIGTGPLQLVISGVRQLTPRIRAFELRDPNGDELPPVAAGAHLQFNIDLHDGTTVTRHYSICSNPARRDAYEIAVLREEKGDGGSRAVHAQFEIGKTVHTEYPQNNFRLHADQRPAVLIAGGVGITPIKPMAQALRDRGNMFHLYYAGRSMREMAFRDRLQRDFGDSLTVYSAADKQRLDVKQLLSEALSGTQFYVCGPGRLIDAVIDGANELGIDAQRIHFERFESHIAADARPISIELKRSQKTIEVPADKSVLDAILESGVEIPHSCKAGNCKSCATKVLAGEPDHRDSALSDVERNSYKLMCPCVSRAESDNLVLDI